MEENLPPSLCSHSPATAEHMSCLYLQPEPYMTKSIQLSCPRLPIAEQHFLLVMGQLQKTAQNTIVRQTIHDLITKQCNKNIQRAETRYQHLL